MDCDENQVNYLIIATLTRYLVKTAKVNGKLEHENNIKTHRTKISTHKKVFHLLVHTNIPLLQHQLIVLQVFTLEKAIGFTLSALTEENHVDEVESDFSKVIHYFIE